MSRITINFPTGSGAIKTSYNKWLIGVRDTILDFQGSSYQNIYSLLPGQQGYDDVFGRFAFNGEVDQNNRKGYTGTKQYTTNDRINQVLAGSTTLTLITPSAAANTAKYRVGARLRIASEDTEGDNGYPAGQTNVELVTITAINTQTGTISFTPALTRDYRTDTRDFPGTSGGGSGLPRICSLDRLSGGSEGEGYTYPDYLEIRNLTIQKPTGGDVGALLLAANNIKLVNVTNYQLTQPSQCLGLYWVVNSRLLGGGESDKELNQGLYQGTTFSGNFTNGRWNKLQVQNGTFLDAGFSPAGTVIEITGTTLCAGSVKPVGNPNGAADNGLPALYPQPGHRPVNQLLLQNNAFTSLPANTAEAHIAFAQFDGYTITQAASSGTDLILPAADYTTDGFRVFRQTCIGMGLSKKDGTNGGQITARRWDASLNAYVVSGTWTSAPAVGDVWVYSSVRKVVDLGGHTVQDSKQLYHRNSLRWKGSPATGMFRTNLATADLKVGSSPTTVEYYGWLRSVSITVPSGGTGTLKLTQDPESIGNSRLDFATIDLTKPGTRLLTGSAWTGALGTDNLDPSALGRWMGTFEIYVPQALPAGVIITLGWENYETYVAPVAYVPPVGRTGAPSNLTYSNTQLVALDANAGPDGNITFDGVYIKMTDNQPCIITNCSKPVIIKNCVLVSAGDLVRGQTNCDVTITNTRGYAIPSTNSSQVPGRFFNGYYPTNVNIQHCYFEGGRGILVDHWGGSDGTNGKTIVVKYNQCRDVDGRSQDYTNSNGNGNYEHSQLVQITNTHIAGIEVAYNEVVNAPGTSRVEDNINIYNAGGTAASHARFHHNYIQGAYPWPLNATYFSGTGITTDGDTDDPNATASYNDVTDNWIVSVCNSGYNIATGHDNTGTRNIIVNSGLYPDGSPNYASYCGCCIYNSANRPTTTFYNNSMQGNTLGYVRTKDVIKRFDQEDPPTNVMPINGAGNTHLPDPITLDTEHAQWIAWQQYCQSNNLTIGPS